MNYKKFFLLAKEKGIEQSEFYITESISKSFSIFHGEIDDFSIEHTKSINIRGLVNGKFGSISLDSASNRDIDFIINSIISNASIIEKDEPNFIFKGSKKYKRIKTYNNELGNIDIEIKKQKLFELEKRIKELDSRISEVESVSYSESSDSLTIINSFGLKLTDKNNSYFYSGGAVATENNITKTGGDYFFDNDFSKFDVDKLARKIVNAAVSQLNGHAPKSQKYKAVLDKDVVVALLAPYISNCSAESVQKNTSLFKDKLNQKIASNKLNIAEYPLKKTIFARNFDDEGVATQNKQIIKNGVLKTYLYNLRTATIDNVESTGNAAKSGGKISTTTFYLEVKPGKKSLDELFKKINNGVYITSISGLHAGLNPQSGSFSLQAEGFLIENGIKKNPLDIITISGNLLDLFNNICDVGNDVELSISGISSPSVCIKELVVAGE